VARKFFNGIDFTGQKGINLGSPSVASDAANKAYVDAKVNGNVWKEAVRAASTTNISLSAPGSTIDDVTLSAGDAILLKNQTDGSENGIYVWAGASAALVRRADANSSENLVPGTTVVVEEGTKNHDTSFTLSTDGPITLDTTALTFVKSGGGDTYINGDGLSLTGTTFSVKAKPQGGITVDSTGVSVDNTVARVKSADIGDGNTTAIAFVHNLGTYDVVVSVKDKTSHDEVYPDVTATDLNTVTLTFATAPTTGEFRVTVIG